MATKPLHAGEVEPGKYLSQRKKAAMKRYDNEVSTAKEHNVAIDTNKRLVPEGSVVAI